MRNHPIGPREVHLSVIIFNFTDTPLTNAIVHHAVLNVEENTFCKIVKIVTAQPSAPFAQEIIHPTTKDVQHIKHFLSVVNQLNLVDENLKLKSRIQYLRLLLRIISPPYLPVASFASVINSNNTLSTNSFTNEKSCLKLSQNFPR